MYEYDLITRILSPRLQPENQKVLMENTHTTNHQASIINGRRIRYTLYRYDQTEQGQCFLPFFNNTHDGDLGIAPCPAPSDLLKFCDYILLAEKNEVLYVLLIELKSGHNGDASKQLDASAVFFEYIKKTASRISNANGYSSFNTQNIKIKQIILKPQPKVRPCTQKAKTFSNWDLDTSPICINSDTLPLYKFCK